MEIRIGSLNCLNFGRDSISKKDIDLIAKIIRNEKFDVVALQEIKSGVIDCLCNNLNCGLSKGKWQGYADNEINDYAFIWNSQNLTLPQTRLANGEIRAFYPHIYKQYGRDPELGRISLARPPFYGRFQTTYPGLPKIEIRLINTHIRYSKGNDGKELAPTISEIALRKFEFQALTKNIYYRISDKIYGKSSGESSPLTAYTILLGDYNLNMSKSGAGTPCLKELESVCIKCNHDSSKNKVIVTKQIELTTLKKNFETAENCSNYFASNYDHFTFDENRFSGTHKKITRVNSVQKYCNGDPEIHLKKVSDHTPIKMTLSPKKG